MVILKKQQGASLVSIMIFLVMGIFFVTLLLRLVPVYAEDSTIGSTLQAVAEDPELSVQSINVYRKKIDSRFSVNAVSVIGSQDVKLQQQPNGDTFLFVEYEKRVRGFFNIDFICKFKHEVKVKVR